MVGGEQSEEIAWAPMFEEQFKIDEAEGKYRYPGIDAPIEEEEEEEE